MRKQTRAKLIGVLMVCMPIFTAVAKYILGELSLRAGVAGLFIELPATMVLWLMHPPQVSPGPDKLEPPPIRRVSDR